MEGKAVTYCIALVVLGQDDAGLYDTFIVHKNRLQALRFRESAESDVSAEFIDFIFHVGIDICAA